MPEDSRGRKYFYRLDLDSDNKVYTATGKYPSTAFLRLISAVLDDKGFKCLGIFKRHIASRTDEYLLGFDYDKGF